MQVLEELDVAHIPMMSVWNKVDVCPEPVMVQAVAEKRDNTVCISAQTGQGLPQLLRLIEAKIQESMLPVDVIIPYDQVRLGSLLLMIVNWHDAGPATHMLCVTQRNVGGSMLRLSYMLCCRENWWERFIKLALWSKRSSCLLAAILLPGCQFPLLCGLHHWQPRLLTHASQLDIDLPSWLCIVFCKQLLLACILYLSSLIT